MKHRRHGIQVAEDPSRSRGYRPRHRKEGRWIDDLTGLPVSTLTPPRRWKFVPRIHTVKGINQ